MKIRAYRDADLPAVAALWDACALNVPYNDPAQDIALARSCPNAALLVGTIGPRLIGTVLTGHDGHRGWMYRLAVDPEYRRQGIGRRLVEQAEDWLAARGLRKLNLMIREDNAAVRAFYARLGYEETPRLVMAKWLDKDAGVEQRRRKIDVVVTYLEMTAAPARRLPAQPPPDMKLALLRAEAPTLGFYRYLYNTVGEPWFWIDRRLMDDAALAAIIADPLVEIYVLYVGGVPAGYVELDRRAPPVVNIAYLGLMPHAVGHGLGRYLVNWAVDAAWRYAPQKLTVDTCTLDHPRALATYQKAGFVAVRQQAKQIDDPRLSGIISAKFDPRLP
jgi:ribosomal protein S18 acetylase RimI-like enzyme